MSCKAVYDTRYACAADALGAEGTLDNNFRLRKRRACATYGNRAAKWMSTKSSETLYFNTMWTWHIDKGLSQEQQGQYSKHIYLGETRIVTKQTSDLEEHYGPSEERNHQYYYHPDHLGSAQLVTDFEGNEYQRIEYTPYGELWVEKKTAHEKDMRYLPYKFTAKEQDEETGLYYYGARYLDAKHSRWLSTDPAVSDYIPMAPTDDEARKHNQQLPGQGGIFNVVNFQLYHYAGNNPVKYTDPDGNSATLIGLITGGIGGAISALIQGNEFGSKKFWAGVAGGVIAGTIAGAAVDLTVLTGGTGGIALGIIFTGGAIGGSAGSTIETLLSGEDLNVLNIIFDGIIGGLGNFAGYKAGKLLEKGVTSAIQKMIKDSTIQMKKDVIQQTSKKFGKLAWALGKNSDKIIKALIEHGGNGAITTVFDILQDIINPGKKNNEANQ